AFARGKQGPMWISSSGRELAVVEDGKLGWSQDAGENAEWRDLPVPSEAVGSVDVPESAAGPLLVVGTDEGLFLTTAGGGWRKMASGLPPGQVDAWFGNRTVWVVGEHDGGLYVSENGGSSWRRVDHDDERSRYTGIVPTEHGDLLVSSQSEGLLLL